MPPMDHSMDNWKHAVEGVAIAFPLLAIASVALRLQARRGSTGGLKADDHIIVAALIITIGACVDVYYSVHVNGLADINPKANGYNLQQVSDGRKGLYSFLVLMYTVYGIIKLSIIAFYKRVFTIPRFKMVSNIMFAVVGAWMVGTVLAQIFSNTPVSGFWQPKTAQVLTTTKAINFAAFSLTTAVFDFVLDVAILLMPVPIVIKLKVDRKKKIYLIGIFWLGFFCVIASAVKIYICTRVRTVTKQTPIDEVAYNNYNILLWFTIEACISIVAACLPTLGPIARSPAVRGLTSAVRNISRESAISLREIGGRFSNSNHDSRNATQDNGSSHGGQATSSRGGGWQEINEHPLPTMSSQARGGRGVHRMDGGGIVVEKSFRTESQVA